MKKLSVLQICTNSGRAGAPKHVTSLARTLKSDVNFTYIFGEYASIAADLRAQHETVFIVNGLKSSISPFRDIFVFYELVKLIKLTKPDLVHCHSTKAGLLGRLAARWCGIPSVYTVHGWGWRGMKFPNNFLVVISEFFARLINIKSFFIFVDPVSLSAAKYFLIPLHQKELILNGTEDSALGLFEFKRVNPNVLTLGMAARVDRAKDHDTLFDSLCKIEFDFRLFLCGAGTDSDVFKEYVELNFSNIFDKIVFLGELSDIESFYRSIDVNLLISKFEALPLSLIEGSSFSKPTIATDTGGVSKVVHDGVNGFLIQPGASLELAGRLRDINNDSRLLEFAKNSRVIYEKYFSVDLMANKVLDIYRKISNDAK